VIADADHVVVAYASMSLSAVDASAAPRALKAGSLPHVPALLCGRLAVDQRFRGLGLGAALVRLVLSKAIEVNATAACRAVVVHALDQEARGFWERFGFHPFTDDPGEQDLYLLTSEIERTLGGLLDQAGEVARACAERHAEHVQPPLAELRGPRSALVPRQATFARCAPPGGHPAALSSLEGALLRLRSSALPGTPPDDARRGEPCRTRH
jgi:predicted GNAT family N-acyltransferase